MNGFKNTFSLFDLQKDGKTMDKSINLFKGSIVIFAIIMCLFFVSAESDVNTEVGLDTNTDLLVATPIMAPVISQSPTTVPQSDTNSSTLITEKIELTRKLRELTTAFSSDKNELIRAQIGELIRQIAEKQNQINQINSNQEITPQMQDLPGTFNPAWGMDVPINPEVRAQLLTQLKKEITNLNEIRALSPEIKQEITKSINDKNIIIRREALGIRYIVSRAFNEAIKQNPEFNFDDVKGLGQNVTLSRKEIMLDTNNVVQARRTVAIIINGFPIQVKNTNEEQVEIVDGNITASTVNPVRIDDNGLSVGGNQIKLLPSIIRARIEKLEKLELKLEEGVAKYDAKIANVRSLFGLIPMTATETVTINANTGKVIGYDRPFWSMVSTGNDAVSIDEEIQVQ
jgi:hypothetical protein